MGKRTPLAAGIGLLLLTAWAGSRALHGMSSNADRDPTLLAGRVWIDKRPDKVTDYVHALYVSNYSAFGFVERASQHQLVVDTIEQKRHGANVTAVFLQTGLKVDFSFTIKTCDDLPPFDLCLDISDNGWGGPKRYYAMTNPDSYGEALGPLGERLRSQIPASER